MIGIVSLPMTTPRSEAIVNMAQGENVDLAIRYGVKMQDSGVQALLRGQWREGPDGVLLNVYTPFMVLASKAARSNTPDNPSMAALRKTKKKFQRTITDMRDPHYPPLVKFAVALYGNSLNFGQSVAAEVHAINQNEPRVVKLYKKSRPREATQPEPKRNPDLFETVNAYYYKADDLAKFEAFEFIITQPNKPPVKFTFKTAEMY